MRQDLRPQTTPVKLPMGFYQVESTHTVAFGEFTIARRFSG